MSKSLERIKFVKEIIKDKQEEYDFLIETDKESANYILTDMKLYEEILNDLEENEVLKQSVKDTYDSSQEIIFDLKKENQELKDENYKLKRELNNIDYDFDKLEDEIIKLKKAIEILKRDFQFKIEDNFLWIYDDYFGALESLSLTEEEINLLKEVLE